MTQKIIIELENDSWDVHAMRESILGRWGGQGANIKSVRVVKDT